MRRVSALFVIAAILAAAFAVWRPGHAAAALCSNPAVTGATPQVAASGATITVSGSGFQNLLCSTTLNVGGVTPSNKPSVVNDSTMTFVAQAGLHGGIQVVESGVGGSNTSNTNIAFYTPPSVTGVSPGAPTTGQAVTVAGSGFNFALPSGDEHVSAAYMSGSSTCAGATAGVASDSAISVSAPGHYCDGAVALGISAPSDLSNASSQITVYSGQVGHVDVSATGMQLSSSSVVAGSSVNVTGSGFGTAGQATLGGAAVPSTWSDTSVTVTVPDTAVSNSPVALTRADGASLAVPGTVGVVAHADGVSPSSAHVGDTVTITGGGFGTNPGTVTLGTTKLTVKSWSPTAIAVTLTSGSQSGALTITPADTSPPAAQPLNLTVLVTQLTTGGPTPTGTSGSGAGTPAKPLTPAQVQQVTSALSAPPPPLPPLVIGGNLPQLPQAHPTNGAIALALKTAALTAAPGKTVPCTVTLKAYGQPVGNAPVQMVIAYEPGRDGTVNPVSGVTNAKGQFHCTVHLSKTPGEMIVLARSGEFSDEVQLVGSMSAAGAHNGGGGPISAAVVPVLVVVLAALLIVAGIGLRVALALTSRGSVGAALLRERLGVGPAAVARRLRWSRWVPRTWAPRTWVPRAGRQSGRQAEPGGDMPSELEVAAQEQPAPVHEDLGSGTAPDEQKERLEVHS